jgi:hypothetical protein
MSFDRESLLRMRSAYADREPEKGADDPVAAERIWAAAAGELSPEETEALALRAAADPDLAAMWALALGQGAAEQHDDTEQVAALLHTEGQVVSLWPRRLAATGLLLAAAAAVLFLRPPPDSDVWRGSETEIITAASAERTAAGLRLDWEATPGAIWSLRVFDPDLSAVYRADGIQETHAIVPLDVLQGDGLTWQVSSQRPDGSQERSPLFPIAPY